VSDRAAPILASLHQVSAASRLRHTIAEGTQVKTQTRAVQPMAIPPTIQVRPPTTMNIHDLSIEQPAVVAYLQAIDPATQEIALVHGIQIGIAELVARRARARAALNQTSRGSSGRRK
jgi:hypothetical protein